MANVSEAVGARGATRPFHLVAILPTVSARIATLPRQGELVNKILANTLALFNGLFALLIILLGGLVGWGAAMSDPQAVARYAGSAAQAGLFGAILGLGLGFVVAVLINGPLALLVHMLQELKAIREQLASNNASGPVIKPHVEPRVSLNKR